MRYRKLTNFCDDDFRRLTGVERFTFKEMVKILKAAEKKKLALGGSNTSSTKYLD